MPGFRGLTLSRCLERPGTYLLLVGWDRLEDHTEGFASSPASARRFLPLYDRSRSEHSRAVLAAGPGPTGSSSSAASWTPMRAPAGAVACSAVRATHPGLRPGVRLVSWTGRPCPRRPPVATRRSSATHRCPPRRRSRCRLPVGQPRWRSRHPDARAARRRLLSVDAGATTAGRATPRSPSRSARRTELARGQGRRALVRHRGGRAGNHGVPAASLPSGAGGFGINTAARRRPQWTRRRRRFRTRAAGGAAPLAGLVIAIEPVGFLASGGSDPASAPTAGRCAAPTAAAPPRRAHGRGHR